MVSAAPGLNVFSLLRWISSLQELGDIDQLLRVARLFNLLDDQVNFASEMIDELKSRHNKITTDLRTRAQRHQIDGQYQGAEYIYRNLASKNVSPAYKDPTIPEDDRSVLVSVYEGLGDFPAAEIVQLRHLKALASQDTSFFDEEVIQEAKRMARLFSLFQERVQELDPELSIYSTLSIFYRAAFLDLTPLNALLYDFHLELGSNGGRCRSLHVAAQNGAANMMRLLLAWGGDINCRSPSGATPLLTAAWHGKVDIVQQLLESKADARATDDSGRTALHMASRRVSGENDINVYILKILLQWNSNIEAADSNGETALVAAIRTRHYLEARFLLSRGANTEVQYWNNEDTILIEAAREGWRGGLQLLLDHKSNQRAKNNQDETALFAAVDSGRKTIVEILLEYGVRSYTSTVKEDASLHCAITRRNEPIAKILIDAGANLDFRNLHGWTPLHLAVHDGEHCEQIYMKLLEKGAHIDSQDTDGNTPLHLAVETENPKTVQNLLGAGASIVIENHDLKSPYGIGIQHPKNKNAKEIASMLEESMAAFVSRFPSPPIVHTAPPSPLSNLPPLPSFSRPASHHFSMPSMGYSTRPPAYFGPDWN